MSGWFFCGVCQCETSIDEGDWIEKEDVGMRLLVCKKCAGAAK